MARLVLDDGSLVLDDGAFVVDDGNSSADDGCFCGDAKQFYIPVGTLVAVVGRVHVFALHAGIAQGFLARVGLGLALAASPSAARDHPASSHLERPAPVVRVVRADATGFEWHVGAKPPEATLVLLHGLGGVPDEQLFVRMLEDLAARGANLRVVSPWLRSPDKQHLFSEELARARGAIAGLHDTGPLFLVGYSLGGKAANALARELGGRVSGVVGLAPAVGMVRDRSRLDPELPAAQVVRVLKAREAAALARGDSEEAARWHYLADAAQFDERRLETGVRVPTLVITGRQDVHRWRGELDMSFWGAAKRFAGENAGVVTFEGELRDDHALRRYPDKIADAVWAFIQARLAAGPANR